MQRTMNLEELTETTRQHAAAARQLHAENEKLRDRVEAIEHFAAKSSAMISRCKAMTMLLAAPNSGPEAFQFAADKFIKAASIYESIGMTTKADRCRTEAGRALEMSLEMLSISDSDDEDDAAAAAALAEASSNLDRLTAHMHRSRQLSQYNLAEVPQDENRPAQPNKPV